MKGETLNIFSINAECDRHFERLIPFLKKQSLDVVLMQEVLNKDIPYLENALQMESIFTPMSLHPRAIGSILGLCIFSRFPLLEKHQAYYKGNPNDPTWLEFRGPMHLPRAIQTCAISKMNKRYMFINTHFTWTPDGKPNIEQHQDLKALLSLLAEFEDFILCGDFNAPRGNIIFDTLAAKYQDNIPAHIYTTIDKKWHKAGDLQLVVDGLFTTPKYKVHGISVVDDLSDHCGILATIE